MDVIFFHREKFYAILLFPFSKNGSQMTLSPRCFENESVGTSLCPKLISTSSVLAWSARNSAAPSHPAPASPSSLVICLYPDLERKGWSFAAQHRILLMGLSAEAGSAPCTTTGEEAVFSRPYPCQIKTCQLKPNTKQPQHSPGTSSPFPSLQE